MPGQWPRGQALSWYFDAGNGDPSFVEGPIARGIASWSEVAGVAITQTSDQHRAQVIVGFLDDLAEDLSVYPDPVQIQAWRDGIELGLTDEPVYVESDKQLIMRLNSHPQGGWSELRLEEVARHECGHALGMGHAPLGTPSVMSAVLDERETTFQSWDIAQIQALYGPPAITVTPAQAVFFDPKQSPLSGSQTLTFTIPGVGFLDLTVSAWNFRRS